MHRLRMHKAEDNSKLPLDDSAHLWGLQFQLTEIEFNATYNTNDIEAPKALDTCLWYRNNRWMWGKLVLSRHFLWWQKASRAWRVYVNICPEMAMFENTSVSIYQ